MNVNSKLLHFRCINVLINEKAALWIYKCTILLFIEYADFIQDQGVVYINKLVSKHQNLGLLVLVAFEQHRLP